MYLEEWMVQRALEEAYPTQLDAEVGDFDELLIQNIAKRIEFEEDRRFLEMVQDTVDFFNKDSQGLGSWSKLPKPYVQVFRPLPSK